LEPYVLMEARLGYEEVHDPELSKPHMGIDESGKGDFFGPMVIAAVYVDEAIVEKFREMDVRDSKTITGDKKANDMAKDIRQLLGHRFDVVSIGPRAYNRLYATVKNVNKILAWGHARAIENLLQKVPECTRAVSDQFGPKRQIEEALMKHGKKIHLHQMPKAESDPAVAAASILARSAFITALADMQKDMGIDVPKGASDRVQAAAREMVKRDGPEILLDVAKCHFRTADKVLEAMSLERSALGPDGAAVSKASAQNAGRFRK